MVRFISQWENGSKITDTWLIQEKYAASFRTGMFVLWSSCPFVKGSANNTRKSTNNYFYIRLSDSKLIFCK